MYEQWNLNHFYFYPPVIQDQQIPIILYSQLEIIFQPIYGHLLLTMVDRLQVAHMCEFFSTYVNNECVQNHDFDVNTDDHYDNHPLPSIVATIILASWRVVKY